MFFSVYGMLLHLILLYSLQMLNGILKFADGSDPALYSGKIIECSWDSDNQEWVFLRVRTDKSTPNEFNTYKKVLCWLVWFLISLVSQFVLRPFTTFITGDAEYKGQYHRGYPVE